GRAPAVPIPATAAMARKPKAGSFHPRRPARAATTAPCAGACGGAGGAFTATERAGTSGFDREFRLSLAGGPPLSPTVLTLDGVFISFPVPDQRAALCAARRCTARGQKSA